MALLKIDIINHHGKFHIMKTSSRNISSFLLLTCVLSLGSSVAFATNTEKTEKKNHSSLQDRVVQIRKHDNNSNVIHSMLDSSKKREDSTLSGRAGTRNVKNERSGVAKATYYFHYTATATDLSSYQNSANWTMVTDPDDPGCDEGAKPCVVQSTLNSVPAFVASISQVSDVSNNTIRTKN